ncbi:MAG: exodeoxyribonuclease VII small subunit [Halioglobus sp.]
MPRKKPESSETPSLEATMKQLEGIVEDLESDDIPLEKALQAFESGIALVRHAQKSLAEAEQKVALLTEDESGEIDTDFLDEDDG